MLCQLLLVSLYLLDPLQLFCFQGSEMHQFVDIFAIPEISLVAQVIEFLRSNAIEYDPEYVFWDVRVRF